MRLELLGSIKKPSGYIISKVIAVAIARDWHSGQRSAFYSFASTGEYIDSMYGDYIREVQENLKLAWNPKFKADLMNLKKWFDYKHYELKKNSNMKGLGAFSFPVFRSSKDGKVFVIINGYRYWIVSRDIYNSLGLSTPLSSVPAAASIPYPTGKDITSKTVFDSLARTTVTSSTALQTNQVSTSPLTNSINTSVSTSIPKPVVSEQPTQEVYSPPAPAPEKPNFIQSVTSFVQNTVEKVTPYVEAGKQIQTSVKTTINDFKQGQQQQDVTQESEEQPEEEKNNTALYISLGVGAAVLVTGVALVVSRKKKKSRSGMGRINKSVKRKKKTVARRPVKRAKPRRAKRRVRR